MKMLKMLYEDIRDYMWIFVKKAFEQDIMP